MIGQRAKCDVKRVLCLASVKFLLALCPGVRPLPQPCSTATTSVRCTFAVSPRPILIGAAWRSQQARARVRGVPRALSCAQSVLRQRGYTAQLVPVFRRGARKRRCVIPGMRAVAMHKKE